MWRRFPWLNLHRPCLYAAQEISAKGKIVKRDDLKGAMTPLEKLAQFAEQKKVTFKNRHSLKAFQDRALQQMHCAPGHNLAWRLARVRF